AWRRACDEGTAFRNLRLLARILNDTLEADIVRADVFLEWRDAIQGLSKSELVFAATLLRHERKAAQTHKEPHHMHARAMRATRDELIGPKRVFATKSDFESAGFSLGRTGLVVPFAFRETAEFCTTPKMERLAEIALCDNKAWPDDI
ncbi:MAG: hypothetical protein AB7T08_01135, partial [Hyphomonadaceae bacterium]